VEAGFMQGILAKYMFYYHSIATAEAGLMKIF